VFERVTEDEITALTAAATSVTFDADGLTPEQRTANQRIVAISAATCVDAAANGHQHLVAAFSGGAFAGYVIATLHADDDRELDWLMVHPRFHGTGVAAKLMEVGMAWLGREQAMWLSVIRHNRRAISFYRRFGFEVDQEAKTAHVVPHAIMRRPSAQA
jgi:ribosomal protein S18 acetylase RimI-like enzyme